MGGLLLSLFFPSVDTGFAIGGFSSAVSTTNGGTDWVKMITPVSGTYNSLFFTSITTGYIAGQWGTGNLPLIMKTTNGGSTWVEQPLVKVGILNSIFFADSDIGYACGRVGLMLKTTMGGVVSVHSNIRLPDQYILNQNYPNPFNPTTSIQHAVSNSQFVSIKVYDVLGNFVATLLNEVIPAGVHEVEWNASDFSSGIYYYKLTAGDPSTSPELSFVETKKMVLIK